MIFFVKVIGKVKGVLQEKTYCKKIQGAKDFSAIQLTTASGVCSVLEMYLTDQISGNGFVSQESISWNDFLKTSYGKVYL